MTVKRSNPDQFLLRLPPGLRDKLKAVADAGDRSLNAEIVRRLEASLPSTYQVEGAPIENDEGNPRFLMKPRPLTGLNPEVALHNIANDLENVREMLRVLRETGVDRAKKDTSE